MSYALEKAPSKPLGSLSQKPTIFSERSKKGSLEVYLPDICVSYQIEHKEVEAERRHDAENDLPFICKNILDGCRTRILITSKIV